MGSCESTECKINDTTYKFVGKDITCPTVSPPETTECVIGGTSYTMLGNITCPVIEDTSTVCPTCADPFTKNQCKTEHQKQKVQKEIRELEHTRRELIKTVQEIKTKNENLTLSIDTILFDNIVMLDKIFKNFEELNKLENALK